MQNLLAIFGISLIGYYLVKNKQAVSENNQTLSDLQNELERVVSSGTDKDSDQDDYIEYLKDEIELLKDPDKEIKDNLFLYRPLLGLTLANRLGTKKTDTYFNFMLGNDSRYQYLIRKVKVQITLFNYVVTEYQPAWQGAISIQQGEICDLEFKYPDHKLFSDSVAQNTLINKVKSLVGQWVFDVCSCNISIMIGTPNGGYKVVNYNNVITDVKVDYPGYYRGYQGENALDKINDYSELF